MIVRLAVASEALRARTLWQDTPHAIQNTTHTKVVNATHTTTRNTNVFSSTTDTVVYWLLCDMFDTTGSDASRSNDRTIAGPQQQAPPLRAQGALFLGWLGEEQYELRRHLTTRHPQPPTSAVGTALGPVDSIAIAEA